MLRVGSRARRWSIGRPKPRVLPEPVFALPQISRPARASAIVMALIGEAGVIPCALRTLTRALATPRSSKVVLVAYESAPDATDSTVSELTEARVVSRLDP